MKLQPVNLFTTPKSQEELVSLIENMFNGPERSQAMVVMMMTWNLCAHLTNDDKEKSSW